MNLKLPEWMEKYQFQVRKRLQEHTDNEELKRVKTDSTLPEWMVQSNENASEALIEESDKKKKNESKVLKFHGIINYCESTKQCSEACEEIISLANSTDTLYVGFSVKWLTSNKVGLVQLFPEDDKSVSYIFHVNIINSMPDEFYSLCVHESISLVGVDIINDMKKLLNIYYSNRDDINLEKVIDLKNMHDFKSLTVSEVVHFYTQETIYQPNSSNWSLEELTYRQVVSAATEAFALIKAFRKVVPAKLKSDILSFSGKIIVCTSISECGAACEELINTADRGQLVLGFDMEWPYDYTKGSGKTALIQICPNESVCYLFHISRMFSLPKALICLLNHKNVRITGLNIIGDLRKLGRDFNINVNCMIKNNMIELNTFACQVLNSFERWSLARLVNKCFGKILLKTSSIRVSNWAQELSKEQIMYAATDAYASLICYESLSSKKS